MSTLLTPSFVEGVLSALAATAIWLALDLVARQLWKIGQLSHLLTFRLSPFHKYLIVVIYSTTLGIICIIFTDRYYLFFVLLALGAIIYPLRWVYSSSQVGLYRVDTAVSTGIDYARALRLAKNSIDFLGTGAFKLTTSAEFEPAIARCNRQDRPIRFLLSHPGNPALVRAAAQAGDSPRTYQHRVQQSLSRLADLKLRRQMNIDVRFYQSVITDESPETFRLMIIDDAICLCSYNIYGRGEGRDAPQLMFRNSLNADNTKLFYICFQQYFESKWAASNAWNPQDYIDSANLRSR
jgi:hypothetical protein